MLKTLHHHIYAGKLQDLFSNSCMVLVYQALGTVNVNEVKQHLEKSISKKQPKAGITASAFRVKNTVVAGTKDEEVSRFFQASNLIIGWQLTTDPSSSTNQDSTASTTSSLQSASQFVSSRSQSLEQLCGNFRHCQPTGKVAQPVIADMLSLSLDLPKSQPLALLACFHKQERVTISGMKQWKSLNEAVVLGELLGTLEGVPGPLLNLESAASGVVEALELGGGEDVTSTLEAVAQQQQPQAPQP